MESVQQHIEQAITKRKKGELIFPSDFRGKGTATAIKMALSRLSSQGKIKRLARGIYFVPKTDPVFGVLYPAPEKVAETLAKKEKLRIKPSGAYAMHKLGLTTQVPTKLVYITDGQSRQIKMGKTVIRFKATTPKKMSLKGLLSSLVIQSLEELDMDKIDVSTAEKIRLVLKEENPGLLMKDLPLASTRIHDYILKLLNESL